jgi:hypothetical protein
VTAPDGLTAHIFFREVKPAEHDQLDLGALET